MHMINAKDPYVCKMVKVLELCGWLNFEWQDPPAPRHWIGLNHWSNVRVLLHTSYDMDWIGLGFLPEGRNAIWNSPLGE